MLGTGALGQFALGQGPSAGGAVAYTLDCTTSAFAETASSASLRYGGYVFSIISASYAETTSSVTPALGRILRAATSSIALSPPNAALRRAALLMVASETYNLSASSAAIKYGVNLSAPTSSYAFSPVFASLTYSQGAQFTVSGSGVEMLYPDYGVSNPDADVCFPYKVVRRTN